MIDAAGDLAALFADPFGFAKPAVYAPAEGSAFDLRVVPTRPDEVVGFGESRLSSPATVFLVQVADVAEPNAGDVITFEGTDYVVQGVPQRDDNRTRWRVDTRPS